jgi:hypothetical protein
MSSHHNYDIPQVQPTQQVSYDVPQPTQQGSVSYDVPPAVQPPQQTRQQQEAGLSDADVRLVVAQTNASRAQAVPHSRAPQVAWRHRGCHHGSHRGVREESNGVRKKRALLKRMALMMMMMFFFISV